MNETLAFVEAHQVWVMAIMLLGGLAHGALGLGFSVLATALLALMVDMRSAIIVTLFPTIVINILSILRGGNWSQSIGRYWPLAVYAVAGSLLGTQLLIRLDPEPFKLLLAAVILLYLYLQRPGGLGLPQFPGPPHLAMGFFGLLAGVLGGTVNVMVPVLIIWALELGLVATAMVQVFNLCFLAGKLSQAAMFGAVGMLAADLLQALLPAAGAAAAGLWLGMRARAHISESHYRRLLRWVMALFALLLILDYFLR
jgi:uncharacterized membrane protein YfcA